MTAQSKKREWKRNLIRIGLFLLSLAPLVYLIYAVVRYHVDIPFWDQWNFVPLLGKSYEAGITLEDLWGLHNEHRLLFPRLIMLGLAHLSRYNIAYELAVNILLAVGILCLLLFQLRRSLKSMGCTSFPWVLPILTLLAFSLNQGENWVWGWQIQIFLNVFMVTAGILLLAGQKFTWRKFAGAAFCGIIATYSFANGFAFWPIGFSALLLVSTNRRKKATALTIWGALAVLVTLSYLYRFSSVSASGKPLGYFIKHPIEYGIYILKYLGATIINFQEYATLFGLIGLIIFAGAIFFLLRKKRDAFPAMLPFFLLGLYSVACAALTGWGRVGLGTVQAMSYRYVTFSNLIWFSNIVFIFILLREIRTERRGLALSRIQISLISLFLFLTVFFVIRTSYRVGFRVLKSYHERLSPVRSELVRGEENELLSRLYIDTEYVKDGIKILKKHNLSVFRKGSDP
jgi:hypothetical protein